MKKFNKKSLVLLVCVAMLLTFTVSGTVAFLADGSGPVTNVFTPVEVDTKIVETVTAGSKSSIQVQNNNQANNIPVYVRVALAGYWVKLVDNKEVIVAPASQEEMTFDIGNKWIRGTDGFYYYTEAVQPGAETLNLLGSPIKGTKNDGSYLVVTVVHQSIQAVGTTSDGTTKVVVDAWGVDPTTLK